MLTDSCTLAISDGNALSGGGTVKTHISVGLLGLGVVGSEVYKLLQDEAFVAARAGLPIKIDRVAVAHV
jgi:hypothetical protein